MEKASAIEAIKRIFFDRKNVDIFGMPDLDKMANDPKLSAEDKKLAKELLVKQEKAEARAVNGFKEALQKKARNESRRAKEIEKSTDRIKQRKSKEQEQMTIDGE